jgi:hypothetical protein
VHILNAMGRVQCIPAVRASRLIEWPRGGLRSALCGSLFRFSVPCLFSAAASLFLFVFVERGEETRGRTKWPRGADTVRELRRRCAVSTCTSRRHVSIAVAALSSCESLVATCVLNVAEELLLGHDLC